MARELRHWAAGLGMGVLAALCASGCGEAEPELALPPASPGYPEHTSLLNVNLDGTLAKACHATLVHENWALTAAHCFSEVSPGASGRLVDFARGFDTRAVVFHPQAHASGSLELNGVWHNAEFRAAHDLALIRIEPGLALPIAAASWNDGCADPDLSALPAHLARLSRQGIAETAGAIVLGPTPADALLGPTQTGTLLALRSSGASPGDSGSGVTVSRADLDGRLGGACVDAEPVRDVLIGVLQDANPDDDDAPLGVTPLYPAEHRGWLRDTLLHGSVL
jgi:hypothetical protein